MGIIIRCARTRYRGSKKADESSHEMGFFLRANENAHALTGRI